MRDAVAWRVSRYRSELLIELALETLVFHGYAEKKLVQRDDESIAYYWALTGQPNHAEGEALGAVQPVPESDAPLTEIPDVTPQKDQHPAQAPQ